MWVCRTWRSSPSSGSTAGAARRTGPATTSGARPRQALPAGAGGRPTPAPAGHPPFFPRGALMPYLTGLAHVARRTGVPVTAVGVGKARGHGPQPNTPGRAGRHTAVQPGGGDYPSLHSARDSYSGLPGPLSHFGLGRSGRIYVIAAGRCYHNAPSTSSNHTSSHSIGIEAENDGSQPWPAEQVEAYHRLCAELCAAYDIPVSEVRGHKEVNKIG